MLLKSISLKQSIFASIFERRCWSYVREVYLDHKLEFFGWKHGYKSHLLITSFPYVFTSAPFSDPDIVLLFPAEQKKSHFLELTCRELSQHKSLDHWLNNLSHVKKSLPCQICFRNPWRADIMNQFSLVRFAVGVF